MECPGPNPRPFTLTPSSALAAPGPEGGRGRGRGRGAAAGAGRGSHARHRQPAAEGLDDLLFPHSGGVRTGGRTGPEPGAGTTTNFEIRVRCSPKRTFSANQDLRPGNKIESEVENDELDPHARNCYGPNSSPIQPLPSTKN